MKQTLQEKILGELKALWKRLPKQTQNEPREKCVDSHHLMYLCLGEDVWTVII